MNEPKHDSFSHGKLDISVHSNASQKSGNILLSIRHWMPSFDASVMLDPESARKLARCLTEHADSLEPAPVNISITAATTCEKVAHEA